MHDVNELILYSVHNNILVVCSGFKHTSYSTIEMGSRIRENPAHIFECFCEVVIPNNEKEGAWILQKYPHDFNDEEMLKSVPEFSCPCDFTNDAVQHFSFVLTSLDSKWTFGYCRHAPNTPTLLVLLSYLPWHETFYKLLNHIAELTNDQESGMLTKFLEALHKTDVPEPGFQLHVAYSQGQKEFLAQCPDHLKLPSIPENRNLTEYFNAIDAHNMMVVFASMLHERRIMISSKKLSRLSACVQAANSLIYPMHWQHIFIPVLPKHLLDYLSAPMPFLIGVPSITMMRVKHSELGEVVVLDADNNRVKSPFNDLEMLPPEIVTSLKRSLKNPNMMLGDGVARAFMRALVRLIGGYRDALKLIPGEKISFKSDAFIQSRPTSIQPFLEKMLQLQIFQQFIEGRLEMLNSGIGFSDEFEFEVNMYEDKAGSRLKNQYKEWVTTMKKEGGAFIKNVKNRANPAVKHAYKSVKDKSKRAYKDFRSKIQEIQLQKHPSQSDLSYQRTGGQPKSAPSSPTMSRSRPFTLPVGNKRISYTKDNENREATLEGISLSNSLSVSGIRRYKMLTVDEVSLASEESLSDIECSPNIQRIDMDLMGDLQDIIFRRCSLSSENIKAETSSGNSYDSAGNMKASTTAAFTDSFCSVGDAFLPAPIPPPRTKRKVPSSQALSSVNIEKTENSKKEKDEPLICLESFDDDALFDPLKEANTKDTELLPFIASKNPSADTRVNELKNTLHNLTASPLHSAKFQPSVYFPASTIFPPRPAQPGLILQRKPQTSYRVPYFAGGQALHYNNVHSTDSLHSNGTMVTENKVQGIPPPLPPKARWSSASTFYVGPDSKNELSKSDEDLLKDYGLSNSPIFSSCSLNPDTAASSAAAVCVPNTTQGNQSSTSAVQDPFDLLSKQDSTISKGVSQNWNVQSSWQKFL